MNKHINKLSSLQTVTESGMLLAVALALASIKLWQMPNGGSVSLSVLPLLIISARHGAITGSTAGVLFGLLSLFRKPFIVHPLQFLLDYPVAFAAIGVTGIKQWKSPKIAVSLTGLAMFLRLLMHTYSGIIFFNSKNKAFLIALKVSFIYNIGYLLPETIICSLAIIAIFKNQKRLFKRID